MPGNGKVEKCTGRDGSRKFHKGEMLGVADAADLGEHTAALANLRIEMAAQRGVTLRTQARGPFGSQVPGHIWQSDASAGGHGLVPPAPPAPPAPVPVEVVLEAVVLWRSSIPAKIWHALNASMNSV